MSVIYRDRDSIRRRARSSLEDVDTLVSLL
jgi:hypothetical protein